MDRITELANELGIDPEAARAALEALKPKVPRVLELAREDAAAYWKACGVSRAVGGCLAGDFDDTTSVKAALIARKRCIETVKEWADQNWSKVPPEPVDALLAALGDE